MKGNKGIILSTYVYILLVFFLFILGTMLVVLNNTKLLSNKLKSDTSISAGDVKSDFNIILIGDSEINTIVNEEFVDPGYIARTNTGKDLEVTIQTNLDTTIEGEYIITYIAKYNGKEKRVTRNIKVYPLVLEYFYDEDTPYYIFPVTQTGYYQIELWGAQGGTNLNGTLGGQGGYVSGKILLNKEEQIYIYIGEKVDSYKSTLSYNGGGSGSYSTGEASNGSNGGGATDVRYFDSTPTSTQLAWNSSEGLNSRIMVAAGGGGGTVWSTSNLIGGYGGGLIGGNGSKQGSIVSATGGTQINGGISAGSNNATPFVGIFGIGGYNTYTNAWVYGGGGGGGYYGGGSGNSISGSVGGPAGGSSYISGHAGCVAVTSSGTIRTDSNNVVCNSPSSSGYNASGYNADKVCSIHHSLKEFTETVMIDGSGQKWEIVNGTLVNTSVLIPDIPSDGNGKVKITFIGNE